MSRRANSTQRDRDGSVLKELPPIWNGLTAKGVTPPVTQAQTEHLPNRHSRSTMRKASIRRSTSLRAICGILFYQNQMQIDGGKNDRFRWLMPNSGALVMGHYDGYQTAAMERRARNTFSPTIFSKARFGGSFLNHFQLICACVPIYPNADKSPAKGLIAAVNPDGVSLTLAPELAEIGDRWLPKFVNNGPDHARLLRRQHHAAAVSAERQQAGGGRRSARLPIRVRPIPCRRSMRSPSATS